MKEFLEVRNSMRDLSLTNTKEGKDLLNKIRNIEKMTEDYFDEMFKAIDGVSKKIDGLNEDFFTKIFGKALQKGFG